MESRSLAALEKFAPQTEFIDVSSGIYEYGKAIANHWTGESDLITIEHDNEITADVISSFANCSCFWCSYSYYVFPKMVQQETAIGLGCTKFSARLQQLIDPSEFLCEDPVFCYPVCDLCFGKGCWNYLDSRIADAIHGHAVTVHCHGQINHHHRYATELMQDSVDIAKAQITRAKAFCENPKWRKLALELAGPNW